MRCASLCCRSYASEGIAEGDGESLRDFVCRYLSVYMHTREHDRERIEVFAHPFRRARVRRHVCVCIGEGNRMGMLHTSNRI